MSAPARAEVASPATPARLVLDVFVDPSRAMEAVATAARPLAWIPTLLVLAASEVSAFALSRRMDIAAMTEKALRSSSAATSLSEAQIQSAIDVQVKVAPFLMLVGAPLAVGAALLFRAGVAHLGMRSLAGGRGAFGRTFAVIAWAYLVEAVNALATAAVVWARPPVTEQPTTSPLMSHVAGLLPAGAPLPLVAGLSVLDAFNLWFALVAGIGLARVHGASRSASWTVLGLLFALVGLWLAGMAALAQIASPS